MMRSILTTASLEDRDQKIYQKSNFMFGDAATSSRGRAADFYSEWREVLSSIKQASLPAILLPVCDEAQEDELAGDPDY